MESLLCFPYVRHKKWKVNFASVRPAHLRESPCKGEQACTCKRGNPGVLFLVYGWHYWGKEGAKLKRRLCRPLKRIQADGTGTCVSGTGARDRRTWGKERASRARPRRRPEDCTSVREVCYDRSGSNFPTLPCKAASCKGSVDKLQMGRTTIGFRVPLRAWTSLCIPSALTNLLRQVDQMWVF
jgi:hypothetical protein